MIKAEEAIKISINNRMNAIEEKIKDYANKGYRKIDLKNIFRLNPDEKRILEDCGFKLSLGHSGKSGEFDIISW